MDRNRVDVVLDGIDLEAGTSLADVGCGEGTFTIPAAERVAPGPVYAIDRDGVGLDEIEAAALERGLGNVTTRYGAPSEFASLLPGPVDVVLVVEKYADVEAKTAFAEQVSRSLRPGGRFVVVGPRPGANGGGDPLDPGETRSHVAPAGLVAVEALDLPGGGVALVFGRRHDANVGEPVS